jgi:hypothetical protein
MRHIDALVLVLLFGLSIAQFNVPVEFDKVMSVRLSTTTRNYFMQVPAIDSQGNIYEVVATNLNTDGYMVKVSFIIIAMIAKSHI